MMPRLVRWLALAVWLAPGAVGQSRTMAQGAHRMEISLERLDGAAWHTIDPGLVLQQGDRVRFKFRTNFDGYLYVMNQSTSGKYEQLFPREETGQDNRIASAKEYQVPATSTAFKIAGPAGFEVVYWMVTPGRLTDGAPHVGAPAGPAKPLTLTPRCDDAMLKARGDCIDTSAGAKLVPRGEQVPDNLSGAAEQSRRDLLFMRQQDTAVIASAEPLTGPVIYEFRLAHR
ncbi:MAG TPA: DUF4384 domain-containing protein [Candidatus Sulfopaludibacter sp.]|jgi:hypothetical protein|nr:DUF4384 domain-containing protein [Candidatus Sulfopaludibacter sp.]